MENQNNRVNGDPAELLLDQDRNVIGFGYSTPSGFVVAGMFSESFRRTFEEHIKTNVDNGYTLEEAVADELSKQ